MMPRVVFLGNHTVGVRSLVGLSRCSEIELVVAHPSDPEDGVVYESVYEHARQQGIPAIRAKGGDPELLEQIRLIDPDILWTTDYRYLIPKSLIESPSLASINLHPSLLPLYRGRAAINWAILNGETDIGLTAHLIDEGVDTGPILRQESIRLERTDDVGDALRLLEPIYERLSMELVSSIMEHGLNATPQPDGDWPIWPRRTPEDGAIDWSQSSSDIVNLVRAVARPYPGARASLKGDLVHVWKARAAERNDVMQPKPGRIHSVDDRSLMVESLDGLVEILEWSGDADPERVRQGDTFE